MTEVSLTLDHIRVGSLALVCASSIWFVFVFVFDFRFVEQGSLTLCVCVSSVLAWDTLTPPPHCVHTPLSQHRTIILFFLFFFFAGLGYLPGGHLPPPKFGHLPPPNSDIFHPPKKNICQEDTCHPQFFFLFLAHFSWLFRLTAHGGHQGWEGGGA